MAGVRRAHLLQFAAHKTLNHVHMATFVHVNLISMIRSSAAVHGVPRGRMTDTLVRKLITKSREKAKVVLLLQQSRKEPDFLAAL